MKQTLTIFEEWINRDSISSGCEISGVSGVRRVSHLWLVLVLSTHQTKGRAEVTDANTLKRESLCSDFFVNDNAMTLKNILHNQ